MTDETAQDAQADQTLYMSRSLAYAARQTKALESINVMVTIVFVLGLVGAGIWLIALLFG